MTTLTQTSFFSRKALFWFMSAIGVLIAVFVIMQIFTAIKNSVSPPGNFTATVAFGKLEKVDFSEGIAIPSDIKFVLQTITGDFGRLPTNAKVFAVNNPVSSFGDLGRAKTRADAAGFIQQPISTNGQMAKFVDKKNSDKILTYDTSNDRYVMQSNFLTSLEAISSKFTDIESPKSKAEDLFKHFGLDILAFPKENIKTLNYKIDNGRLKEADSLSTANLIQVNYGRADIDKSPVFYANFNDPEIWAIVSNTDVVAARSYIWPVVMSEFATYPLIGPSQAFEKLKAGGGAMNRELPDKIANDRQFTIFNVGIGYIISQKSQDYLQPFYIFKGEGDLIAYVPAVDPSYIQETQTNFPSGSF